MTEILFYKIAQRQRKERLICALTQRLVEQSRRVFVCVEGEAQLERLDGWLWTLDGSSFLPHTRWPCTQPHLHTIFLHPQPIEELEPCDVLIAARACEMPYMRRFTTVIDFVESYNPARLEASRGRFKSWKNLGIKPDYREEGVTANEAPQT